MNEFARRPWRAFALIFVLSMGVRLICLAAVSKESIETPAEAEKIAAALVTKGDFADPYIIPTGYTAHSAPFYPALLSCIYRVLGTGYLGNLVRCILLISVYSVLYALFPTFARGFGFPPAVGLMAGVISACLPLKRSAEVFVAWDEPYSSLLLVGLLLLTKRIWSTQTSLGMAALYGVGWGMVYHMTPSLLPVQFGFCAFDLLRLKTWRGGFSPREASTSHAHPDPNPATASSIKRSTVWWIVCLAATVLTVLPWTLRNHARLGGWMFIRSDAGLELYLSNQDGARPSHGESLAELRHVHPFKNEAVAARIRDIGEVAYNREVLRKAEAWVAARPWTFLSLTVQRALRFWIGPPDSLATTIPAAALTALAFLGLAAIRHSSRLEFYLFGILWLLYPSIYYLVSYINRYRAPIEWTITLCACVFLYQRLAAGAERKA